MEAKSRDRQVNARPMTLSELSQVASIIAKEYFGYNNAKRLLKGIDPVTGEKTNCWIAGGELTFDLVSTIIPPLKAGKVTKVGKLIGAVDDVSDVLKLSIRLLM